MSRLVVSNLSIDRADLPVVSSVDLVAESGAISVVLGANGAGKTTLLEGLSGIIPVAGGTIAIDGRELKRRALASARARALPTSSKDARSFVSSPRKRICASACIRTPTSGKPIRCFPNWCSAAR